MCVKLSQKAYSRQTQGKWIAALELFGVEACLWSLLKGNTQKFLP